MIKKFKEWRKLRIKYLQYKLQDLTCSKHKINNFHATEIEGGKRWTMNHSDYKKSLKYECNCEKTKQSLIENSSSFPSFPYILSKKLSFLDFYLFRY